jgi:uncharacterized damage-inducible protein DinB
MEVKDLIRYNHIVRELYLDAMSKMPWERVVESRGLSFDSMRGVFLHLTLVEDRWINYTITGRLHQWVDLDFDAFKDVDSLKSYILRVQANTERYLEGLLAEELGRQIVVPWGDKPDTKITVEKALTHMVLEDMIHYGELSAAFWQKGLEAPYMGFWRYSFEKTLDSKILKK